MAEQFSFPTFEQMYPCEKRRAKRFREYLRYHFNGIKHYRIRQQFVQFLNQHPRWIPIFSQNFYRVNALLNKYCDQRFHGQQRLDAIVQNFQLMEQKLTTELLQTLLQQGSIKLAQLTDELSLHFTLNQIDPFEGFLAFSIQNQQGEHIYDASFTFLAPNKLLIASIQGPNSADAQERVKLATKQLHGVRPMFMLVYGFKVFSDALHCELMGIGHKQQAKYRWNDKSRLLFNYDEFWQENNGVLNAQGYWALPLQIERKPLDDIQSKKRSMYRKRYDMLDHLTIQIHHLFGED